MKPLVTKYAWVSTLIVLMLAAFSSASSAHIWAYPDTVKATTSNVYYISITDGRDTNTTPKTPLTYAHLSVSGSSDWSLFSDSTVSFFGDTYAVVEYKTGGSTPSTAYLYIVGDSNTAVVVLKGNPPDHSNLSVLRGTDFYNQRPGHDTCHQIVIYNSNSFGVSVTGIHLTQFGNQYSLSGLPSLPLTFGSHDSLSLTVCFKDSLVNDSGAYSSTLGINYSYSGGSDVMSYPIYGSMRPYDTTCLNLSTGYVGYCAPGSSASRTVTLTNYTDSSVTIDSVWYQGGNLGGAFTLTSPTFPVTIAAKSAQNVTFQFAPPSSTAEGSYYETFMFWDRGTSNDAMPCGLYTVGVTANVLVPIADTTYLNVPADSSSTITLTATSTVTRHAFIIHNASSSQIMATTLVITSGDSVASFDNYGSTAQLYDTIDIGHDSKMVVMKLDVPDTGSYNIGLVLNYYNSLLSQSYSVKVHRVPSASAAVEPKGASAASEFTMNPNPARGEVTISLPNTGNSTVEIYDVLGNLLLTKQASGRFAWDGSTSGSSSAASGSYVVRVLQHNEDGTILSSAKRLVFVR